jgi:hypothetical protein
MAALVHDLCVQFEQVSRLRGKEGQCLSYSLSLRGPNGTVFLKVVPSQPESFFA